MSFLLDINLVLRKDTPYLKYNYRYTTFGHNSYITKDHVEFCKHTRQPSGSPTLIPCRKLFRENEKKKSSLKKESMQ
jgi:hypothetical protein